MGQALERAFLARLFTAGLALALMTTCVPWAHAQVIGADGANGANGVNPGDSGLPGGDGESVAGSGTVIGGNGGAGGDATPSDVPGIGGNGGNGGNGGAATAAGADANAVGGNGGPGGFPAALFPDPGNGFGGNGGAGGAATAIATGGSAVSASATGGSGGEEPSQICCNGGDPGAGGDANATANASAAGGGTATANAAATPGLGGDGGIGPIGSANASSTATTSRDGVSVQSNAAASSLDDSLLTTLAIAQSGSGQGSNPGQTAYSISTIFPDKTYAETLIGSASNVADALLGPRDEVLGIAILGTNIFSDAGGGASTTFDFTYQGELLLGLVDDDSVTNVSSDAGVLTLDAPGTYVIGAVIPESSTWAMTLIGFAGLGFAGIGRRARPLPLAPETLST